MARIQDTVAVKGYFRNDARFGRTTILIDKRYGEKLFECMGIVSRKDAFGAFQRAKDFFGR